MTARLVLLALTIAATAVMVADSAWLFAALGVSEIVLQTIGFVRTRRAS